MVGVYIAKPMLHTTKVRKKDKRAKRGQRENREKTERRQRGFREKAERTLITQSALPELSLNSP